jgi:DNA-binding SARP family transcriptional activator
VEFRILGRLAVLDDGGNAVEPAGAKPRVLLAMLLLNANGTVSSDQLLEALWGDRVPTTAQKALQVYVSQLRKLLGRERILTRPRGYELVVADGELDLDRFVSLRSQGDLAGALALWRGEPLADFRYEPFAQAEIARLGELRLATLEERVERELEMGRHAELVGELEPLVREHPLREGLRAQLMLALYRSGRQAEALDVYQTARSLLSDELGLEPGPALSALQRRILTHDPTLDAPMSDSTSEAPRPPSVAVPPDGPRPREGRKTVTVVACEVAASRSGLDPESLRHLTARGFEELVPVLEAHGATVERSMGGTLSAIFGVPVVHEDDALRAARAAVEMRDRLASAASELVERWGCSLELRVGIGTGEVLVGTDGDRPFTTGQPVQVALRLQEQAAPGELLVDERTHRLVRGIADLEPLGDRARLLGVRPVEVAVSPRFESPMVGRVREKRRVHDAFEQALGDRSCQLFTVVGAPGVGKSRLVAEFLDDVVGQALIARGRCLPYGEGITYWPVREAVRDAAALDDTDSAEANVLRLTALLEGADDARLVAEKVAEVVGLSDRTSAAEETFSAVRTFAETLARRMPLVLVFDDIHWAEPTFLDLVDHMVEWASDAPILVVCIARPELLETRSHWGGGKANATSIRLEPLSEADSAALLANLAGPELGGSSRQRIVETAGGNPLFVEEMLALFLEDGRQGDDVEVPATIQALLATRLDRLPEDERLVIEAASIEGKVFHEASVAELSSAEHEAVHACLLALARRDLIRSDRPDFAGQRAYHFRHLLIRDAAYDSIPKETRARLHELHAVWLDRNGQETAELEEISGYHYEQAFLYRSELGPVDDAVRTLGRAAAERLGAAGRRAFMRSDAPAGVNLISRSVALLAPDDPYRVELIPNVRVVQGLADLSWADRVLTEAVEAAATTGDRGLAAHALVQRGFLRLFFSDSYVTPAELFDVSERARDVFADIGDDLGLARAWRLAAQAHYLDRGAGACAEASERAFVHARVAGDAFEEREIVEWLVIAQLLGPMPAEDALRRCKILLDQEWDDFWLPAEVSSAAAALAAMQGRAIEAEELVARARRAMEDAQQWIWITEFWHSFVRVLHGDPARAEAELRTSYDALKRVGETTHFSSIAHALAGAVYLQGRYEEARELADECRSAAGPNDIHSQIMWRSVRAKVAAREQDFALADRLAREAIAIAEGSDFLLAHADARADLSEIHHLAGRPGDAVRALEDAIQLYVAKGNVAAADLCRDRLSALRPENEPARS